MPYESLPDEALAALIGRRDPAALAALYDRYARHAHAVALLVTRDPDQAAGVVEALFWRVWQQQGRPPILGASLRNSLMLSARRLAEALPIVTPV